LEWLFIGGELDDLPCDVVSLFTLAITSLVEGPKRSAPDFWNCRRRSNLFDIIEKGAVND
jgi:hypothetical protein